MIWYTGKEKEKNKPAILTISLRPWSLNKPIIKGGVFQETVASLLRIIITPHGRLQLNVSLIAKPETENTKAVTRKVR